MRSVRLALKIKVSMVLNNPITTHTKSFAVSQSKMQFLDFIEAFLIVRFLFPIKWNNESLYIYTCFVEICEVVIEFHKRAVVLPGGIVLNEIIEICFFSNNLYSFWFTVTKRLIFETTIQTRWILYELSSK